MQCAHYETSRLHYKSYYIMFKTYTLCNFRKEDKERWNAMFINILCPFFFFSLPTFFWEYPLIYPVFEEGKRKKSEKEELLWGGRKKGCVDDDLRGTQKH